ncbi:hypothetical protein B0O99DRAFT_695650 [Bisporella sp. PMI_857]|nr:hypothetical protein B0O99DRAFT_695650 [Bisporella sp. PMI_857]
MAESITQNYSLPAEGRSGPPDIMNDPQFESNTQGGEDEALDQCRICRGEGTSEMPLYYPCKCSGSIKHVHQQCLMEWLSHSQKKHCELCKTPFRFTKLYNPNMPQSLPTRIFIQHSLLHAAQTLATGLRICLVVGVWLGCLPFGIRLVWQFLFWFSDGGWPVHYEERMDSTLSPAMRYLGHQLIEDLAANGTSPRIPWLELPTTSAHVERTIRKVLAYIRTDAQTLEISSLDPLASGALETLWHKLGKQAVIASGHTYDTFGQFMLPGHAPSPRSRSLLSDVSFLRNLTRLSLFNQLIINILEGYIITILVVVSFILVFLIREWVVQQQPIINMGAAFNPEIAGPELLRNEQPGPLPENDDEDQVPQNQELAQRPLARPRRAARPRHIPIGNGNERGQAVEGQQAPHRPPPVRDALTPAAEIQRQLAEEPRRTEEFLAMWRRANSDPQEVLRIIEREDKADEMRYWVNAMRVLASNPPDSWQEPINHTESQMPDLTSSLLDDAGSSSVPQLGLPGVDKSNINRVVSKLDSERGSASGESWIDIPESIDSRPGSSHTGENSKSIFDDHEVGQSSLSTAKGKALEQIAMTGTSSSVADGWQATPSPFISNPRPRATSDGPQLKDTISPLANNNWSFHGISSQENDKPRTPDANKGAFEFRAGSSVAQDEILKNQEWKDAQDLRVQQAITRGRESLRAKESNNHDSDFDGPIQVRGQDGIMHAYASVEELFERNPVDSSESEDEESLVVEPDAEDHLDRQYAEPELEANPFALDTPLPPPREPIVEPPPEGFFANIADWLWGGVEGEPRQDAGANDEHVIEDFAAEAPFLPVARNDQDPEVREAARQAGIDLDALAGDPDGEDQEDFDGIMELIGMRGPLSSLAQNAIFSAFLLSMTVVLGIWIPYNIGRVCLLLLANPGSTLKLPLKFVFWCAAFVQDIIAAGVGMIAAIVLAIMSRLFGLMEDPSMLDITAASHRLMKESFDRVLDGAIRNIIGFSNSDVFIFSAASHEALLTLQYIVTDSLEAVGSHVASLCTGDYSLTLGGAKDAFLSTVITSFRGFLWLPVYLARPDSWVISLEVAKRATPLDLELSVWGGWDRFWAILSGYTALSLLGIAYVKRGSPFSTGQAGRDWEATIHDLLNQAGGVMKVILIISIEMLVFPLYCGLLLDVALLPLFDKATLVSRILFTFDSPFTSIFVHWFVGTCYMFHFALFVSMCRKIMRKGVLYFIRDPDDPTFHPVRDVLERNVSTQLRKILFSALVYGALVVICLGGVVWGLATAFDGVFPIHWSSNEPVLEFPIDLLFYNFLMPLAVKFFKPSDGLHAMYTWWFQRCARMLRLTWFMFGERKRDEEGQIVRRSWKDIFHPVPPENLHIHRDVGPELLFNDPDTKAYIRADGYYARAPASDQVRIKKGSPIFLEVDEFNKPLEGQPIHPDRDAEWNSDMYKHVYIPPYFRFRIFLFICSLWIFAAFTGVCTTIVPLVFGRRIFEKIIPENVQKNDVYAFSIGIYILGSILYIVLHAQSFAHYAFASLSVTAETPANAFRRIAGLATRIGKFVWTYTAVLFILPTLFAFVIEAYAILPLHTYFSPLEPHVIHFVQSWTLGLLYVKLTTRAIQYYPDSRAATSLRQVTRKGYMNPDAWLATRSFIFPGATALSLAISIPWLIAQTTVTCIASNASDHRKMLIFRFVYPAVLAFAGWLYCMYFLAGLVKLWRARIKDEVYLIGERLHNFGERKISSPNTGVGARQHAVQRIDA